MMAYLFPLHSNWVTASQTQIIQRRAQGTQCEGFKETCNERNYNLRKGEPLCTPQPRSQPLPSRARKSSASAGPQLPGS